MAKAKSNIVAGSDQVNSFMESLDHPHKAAINDLRAAIKTADSRIVEEIKWNAPSFKLEDHFATFKLHPPKSIQIVLHRGVKPKPLAIKFQIEDRHGLVHWKAPDRCLLEIPTSEMAIALKSEIVDLVRQWIAQLE